MQSEHRVRDLQTAEWVQQEHYNVRSEIDARCAEYTEISQLGHELLNGNHYAAPEIENCLKQLDAAYDTVKKEWQLRNDWVGQVRIKIKAIR